MDYVLLLMSCTLSYVAGEDIIIVHCCMLLVMIYCRLTCVAGDDVLQTVVCCW